MSFSVEVGCLQILLPHFPVIIWTNDAIPYTHLQETDQRTVREGIKILFNLLKKCESDWQQEI